MCAGHLPAIDLEHVDPCLTMLVLVFSCSHPPLHVSEYCQGVSWAQNLLDSEDQCLAHATPLLTWESFAACALSSITSPTSDGKPLRRTRIDPIQYSVIRPCTKMARMMARGRLT